MNNIEKAAVIGAGVMGAGIAAHIANAGIKVVLLDRIAEDGDNRNAIAEGAIARLLKSDPAPLMHKRNAKLITPGNIEDHLELLGECDWIVEAVIEDIAIKRALYGRIDNVRKPGALVTSNTSTIPLAVLTEGMNEALRGDFLITHFFNPPRYMRLLELVAGPGTRMEAVETLRRFTDINLGKGVVNCNDTPGFIGNRIGIYWLQCAVSLAMEQGISIETADAVIARPVGIPRTGVFGLLDLVGLDLMPHILKSMAGALPESDPFHEFAETPPLITRMIKDSYTGRKGKGGFYRLQPDNPDRVKEAIDLASGEYHVSEKPRLASVTAAAKGGFRALLEHDDEGGRYGWQVMARTLSYAASLVPEIADDIAAIDEAMRLGYNWKWGPFELIDQLSTGWLAERLKADGRTVPKMLEVAAGRPFYRTENGRLQYMTIDGDYHDMERADGVLLLADIKRCAEPVARNKSASLWDIGDGVACLEFHSKMNSLNPLVMWMINRSIRIVPSRFKALVIYNEGSNFSVGANLGLALIAAKIHFWPMIRALVRNGQHTYHDLKFAPFPVIAAPSGLALGGACEILLHADAVQAHAETYTGLVEAGVGVVPGWGGCKEMLLRWFAKPGRAGGPMPPVIKVFETVATAQVVKSAAEARDFLFLRDGDGITMNRDRLLADAKEKALELANAGYRPPQPGEISLPGRSARAAMCMAIDGFRLSDKATPHDVVVGTALAGVLSGGNTDITETLSEQELLSIERDGFMNLVRTNATVERIRHMLKTGKPLRN